MKFPSKKYSTVFLTKSNASDVTSQWIVIYSVDVHWLSEAFGGAKIRDLDKKNLQMASHHLSLRQKVSSFK